MTERKESVVEAVKHPPTKNDMFTQETCMEDEELGLQILPHVYQQNIVVEVPVINGEPPAVLHSSRNIDELGLLESEKIFGAVSQRDHTCEKIGEEQSEQESGILNMQKQERIRRHREQNRFRMRALRASDSEVAKRLRENNKFRMRMLRASGSQVAEGIRERNKYRMRELRSAESQLIEKCENTSLDVGEYFRMDQLKLNLCLEGRRDLSNFELDPSKREFKSHVSLRSETNKWPCTCLVKEQLHDKSLNNLYPEQSQKQNLKDKSINIIPNELMSNTEQLSGNSVCNSVNADYHCSCITTDRNEPEILQNEHNSDTKEDSKTCDMRTDICCMQCGLLGSTALETCTHSNKSHYRGPCIVHTGKDQVLDNFSTHFIGKMGQYHRIKIQNDTLSRDLSFTHFMRVEELEEQHKIIKGTSSTISETSISDLNDQRKQRRERGKLRMRLKRHSETEEEAQRRRERGRLRMRVLRASETEEQAARRRELNRIRMRLKRNSAKQ